MTEGFSFAYLKEAYIASLLTLGREAADGVIPDEEEDDRKWGRLGNLLQKQVVDLREEMVGTEKSEVEKEKGIKVVKADKTPEALRNEVLRALCRTGRAE